MQETGQFSSSKFSKFVMVLEPRFSTLTCLLFSSSIQPLYSSLFLPSLDQVISTSCLQTSMIPFSFILMAKTMQPGHSTSRYLSKVRIYWGHVDCNKPAPDKDKNKDEYAKWEVQDA